MIHTCMQYFFTSDHHFGHAGVLKHTERPFPSIKEMDEALIAAWNSRVKQGDSVYHLGDFSFHKRPETESILRRLQGQKFIVLGNHDKILRKGEWAGFAWMKDYYELRVPAELLESRKIVLCHYGIESWAKAHYGSVHLHGHSHGTLAPRGRRMDVGVDTHPELAPYSLEEVIEVMRSREFVQVDHHDRRTHSAD